MSTAQIARAFLVPEPTMAQRLVRAKRKITPAGIPFAIPALEELAPRLDDVLTVIYLTYNAGYLDPSPAGIALTEDAVWLAELVARALPEQAGGVGAAGAADLPVRRVRRPASTQPAGWSCWRTRTGPAGTRWRSPARTGTWSRPPRCAGRAATSSRRRWPAATRARPTWAETDWLQIVILYDMLVPLDPSPVIRLNQAIALSQLCGPEAALAAVDEMADRLDGYHLFHATRAQLLARLGDHAAARAANERALALTDNPAEQALLHGRLSGSASA